MNNLRIEDVCGLAPVIPVFVIEHPGYRCAAG